MILNTLKNELIVLGGETRCFELNKINSKPRIFSIKNCKIGGVVDG